VGSGSVVDMLCYCCCRRKVELYDEDDDIASFWWASGGKLYFEVAGDHKPQQQVRALRISDCPPTYKQVEVNGGDEHAFKVNTVYWSDLQVLANQCNVAIDDKDPLPVHPGCLNSLGLVVEPVFTGRGLWQSVNGDWYNKGNHELIQPEGAAPSESNIQKINGVDKPVNTGRYLLHHSFPGIKPLESYCLVDERTKMQASDDNFEISGAVHVDPMKVGVEGAFAQESVMSNAVSAGSGQLEAYFFEPKAVLEWKPDDEVPEQHWGKEFIRSMVVGAEAKATIRFSRGKEKASHTTGDRVSGNVSTNPAALAAVIPNGSVGGGYSRRRAAATEQGPVAAEVKLEGLNIGARPYEGQPLEAVLKQLSRRFRRHARKPETWQVLRIETCANEKASKEAEQRAQQEKEEEAKRHLEAEKKRLEDDFAQEIEIKTLMAKEAFNSLGMKAEALKAPMENEACHMELGTKTRL